MIIKGNTVTIYGEMQTLEREGVKKKKRETYSALLGYSLYSSTGAPAWVDSPEIPAFFCLTGAATGGPGEVRISYY